MPEIPRQIAPAVVGLPEASPAQYARGYGALARGAQQIESMAQYGMHVAGAIKRMQDHVTFTKSENLIEEDIHKYAESLKTMTDYRNLDTYFQQFEKQLRDKYQAEYGNDPDVWSKIEPYLSRQLEDARHTTAIKRIALIQDDGKYNLDLLEQRMAAQYSKATPEERATIENKMEISWLDAWNNGILTSETEIGKRRKKWMETREETEVIDQTKSSDPAQVQLGIDRLQEGTYYKHIDSKKQATYLAAAEGHLASLNSRIDKETRETAVNNAVLDLKGKWGTDYERIVQDLRNPETWKKYGLDVKGVEQVRQYVNGERAEFEYAKHDASEREYKMAMSLLAQGKFSEVRKIVTNPGTRMDGEHIRTLTNALDVRIRRGDDDITNAENAKEYLRLKTRIEAGDDPREIEKDILTSENLKTATRYKLIDRTEMVQEKKLHSGLVAADKLLMSQIAPPKTTTGISIPEENQLAQDAQVALQDWVIEQKQLEAQAKRKPLTEREIYDKAKEMIPTYSLSYADKVRIMKGKIEEMKTARKIKPGEKPATEPAKNQIGTKDGKPVYDLGNGKWQIGD